MSFNENIEKDTREFLSVSETQNAEDQYQTLKNLLYKYAHMNKADHMMDASDFRSILGSAKSLMARKSFPLCMGKDKVKIDHTENANLCVVEATISHLNLIDCLKRLPKFDYREDKF